MSHTVITTRAIIIHTRPSGEAHRILTLLTEHYGTVHVFARSIRLEKSRMRSTALPYALVSVSIICGRQYILKDIHICDPLTTIWSQQATYTSYVTLLHFIRSTIPAVGHHDPAVFALILDAIESYTTRPPSQADAILLTTQVCLLHRLGYVHDESLLDTPFPAVVSMITTSAKQQTVFKKHLKDGMLWQ